MMLQEPLWTSSEVDIALDHMCGRPWYADGVQVDSREVLPGDLFVALKGATTDGHNHVEQALNTGAVAALVERDASFSDAVRDRLVVVKSTADAMKSLAAVARSRAPAQVIGVTGSAGKTSVVQALRQVLSRVGPTHASIRSFNNHVGVPLSMMRMPRHVRFGVFELGMSSSGEIHDRAVLVKPDVAVITTVGPAHLASFSSEEEIARTKAEILHHVAPGGVAVLGADHPHISILQAEAREHGIRTIVVSTKNRSADIQVTSLAREENGSLVTADVMGTTVTYRLPFLGDAWILNSLLILGAAQAVGVDLAFTALALSRLQEEAGRGRHHHLNFGGSEITLVDDSYNANPLSMNASLKRVALMEPRSGGQKTAVLADMRELGFEARRHHEALAPALKASGITKVLAVGAHMARLAEVAGVAFEEIKSLGGLAGQLIHTVGDGDILLVKGSNGAGLGALVQDLVDLGSGHRRLQSALWRKQAE